MSKKGEKKVEQEDKKKLIEDIIIICKKNFCKNLIKIMFLSNFFIKIFSFSLYKLDIFINSNQYQPAL